MNRKRSFFHRQLFSCTLIALFPSINIGCLFNPAPAQARPLGSPPGANSSNGTRGGCFAVDRERALTALVDRSDPALTTQANPTFLFYSPFGRTSVSSQDGQDYSVTVAEFELLDENENSVLKQQKILLSLPEKPGIVKLKLPNTETSLEPDKEYLWIFRIICDPNDNSANPSVAGWIKRVSPGSSVNVWFDRLDHLAQSRTNYLEDWTKLLAQFDLQDFTQTPIVELKPEAKLTTGEQDDRNSHNQLPTRTYGDQ